MEKSRYSERRSNEKREKDVRLTKQDKFDVKKLVKKVRLRLLRALLEHSRNCVGTVWERSRVGAQCDADAQLHASADVAAGATFVELLR